MDSPQTPSQSLKIRKTFLLVFHGGMVLYLGLHNLVIPLVRNLGQHKFLLTDIHLWFLPQAWLFFLFYRHDLRGECKKSLIPWVTRVLSLATLLAVGDFVYDVLKRGKFELEHFSTSLTLLSLLIFWGVYYVYFHQWFVPSSKQEDRSRQVLSWVLSFALASLYFLSEKKLAQTYRSRPESRSEDEIALSFSEERGCARFNPQGQGLTLTPLTPLTFGEFVYDDCGFQSRYFRLQGTFRIKIVSKSSSEEVLRLERLNGGKWNLQRIFHLSPEAHGDRIDMTAADFKEEGLYWLRSGLKRDKGVLVMEVRSKDENFQYRETIKVSISQGVQGVLAP